MNKQSLFFKFFIALVLFTAISVLLITTIFSYQVASYSEKEISRSAIGKLQVADNLCMMIAENLYRDALKLSLNENLNSLYGNLSYDEIMGNADNLMRIYYFQQSLRELVSTNNILHSVYLLPEESNFIITSNQGASEVDDFPDNGWMDSYKEFSKRNKNYTWLPARNVSFSNNQNAATIPSDSVITLFYDFTPYTSSKKCVLVFNIYEKALLSMINTSSQLEEGTISIVNSFGQVVSAPQGGAAGIGVIDHEYLRKIENGTSQEGYIISRAGSQRQLVTYHKSSINNWIYVGVFPISTLMSKVNSLTFRTALISVVYIILGILAAFYLSRRFSSPLNKLIQDIRTRKGIDVKKNESETAILAGAFEEIVKEEDRLTYLLENNKENIKNVYLMDLLQGKPVDHIDREVTGVRFAYDSFLCAVIAIDKYRTFTDVYSTEQQTYMKALILKVSEQLLNEAWYCAGILYDRNRIALLINFDGVMMKNAVQELRSVFIRLQEEISKVFDMTISIGIGTIQHSESSVSDSFEKAQEALRYKLTNGYGSISFAQEISNTDISYYYPYEREKQLFNLINTGMSDKIANAVSELISEIKNNREIHYENITQVFNQLAVNTVKFVLDQHINLGMIFGSSYNIYQKLSASETLEDIRIWLTDLYVKIAEYLLSSRSLDKNHIDRTMDYIHKNYKKDIDINAIADSVGISYSHLRKIFKDETGDNIVNYINNLRISESKRLLQQTSLPIREIAVNLGYNNEQSFIRFFKKYERISPGEFRIAAKHLA